MKNYVVKYSGTSKVAAALTAQLAPNRAGHVLIESGFNQDNFTLFIARLAIVAIKAGYDETKLAALLRQVGAANASQARQALADAVITVDGEKQQSLGAFWGDSGRAVPVDVSLYESLYSSEE